MSQAPLRDHPHALHRLIATAFGQLIGDAQYQTWVEELGQLLYHLHHLLARERRQEQNGRDAVQQHLIADMLSDFLRRHIALRQGC